MDDQTLNQHMKHTYVPAFDGLRGIVLTVLFVHLEALCPIFEGHVKSKFLLFSQTWYTLNIFFCLSGFLITWLLANEMQATGQLNLLRFYKRRTVRLLPAYLTALLVSCWLASLWGYTPKEIFSSSILFLTYTYNIAISMHGGYFSYALGFLLPVWSLCVEEQFYFAWSVALKWLKMKYALRAMVATLILLQIYQCALLYYMNHAGYSQDQIGVRFYFGSDTRINAILVGCAAALVLQNRKYYDVARKYMSAKSLPFLLPVIITLVVFGTAKSGEAAPAYQLYGGAVSLVLLAAWIVTIFFQPTSLVSRILSSRLLVMYGRISYGLYIFHFIVIRLVAGMLHISADITTPPYSATRNIAAWFLVLVLTTLVATVHYHLIELPLQRRFKGAAARSDKPKPAPALQPQPARASFSARTLDFKP